MLLLSCTQLPPKALTEEPGAAWLGRGVALAVGAGVTQGKDQDGVTWAASKSF